MDEELEEEEKRHRMLYDIQAWRVDLVKRPANGRRFLLWKGEEEVNSFQDELDKTYLLLEKGLPHMEQTPNLDVEKHAKLLAKQATLRQRLANDAGDAEARQELSQIEKSLNAIYADEVQRQSAVRDIRKSAQIIRSRQARQVLAVRVEECLEAVKRCGEMSKSDGSLPLVLELYDTLERTQRWLQMEAENE